MNTPETKIIAGAQIDVHLKDPNQNLDKMLYLLEKTTKKGATLTVFPECSLNGYCFESQEEVFEQSHTIESQYIQRALATCASLKTHMMFGFLEKSDTNVFNTCLLLSPNGILAHYRKTHIPYLGADRFVTAGNSPLEVINLDGLNIGMIICYDGTFPEPSRVLALAGADIILLPTGWPAGSERVPQHVIPTRALENNTYFFAVNRVGVERGFSFIGHSMCCDPEGDVISKAPNADEALLFCEVDPNRAKNKQIIRIPNKLELNYFEDRRPDLYKNIVDDSTYSSLPEREKKNSI